MNLSKYKRIVIKIGSSTITDDACRLRAKWLKSVASDILALRKLGKDIIIVTSGGVALGSKIIGKKKAEMKLEEKQAACAYGQIELMSGYIKAFKPLAVAQVLITAWDTERRRNYLNAKNAIETMLKYGIIPVINENDVIATAELHYGDNDRLSARVAQMLGADLLVLLSDVDGLYTANPNSDKSATHLCKIAEITPAIEKMAGGTTSGVGSGGMITKVEAAKIAVAAGCACIITNGNKPNPLKNLFAGKINYSIFLSKLSPLTARKAWILAGVKPIGKFFVDSGAEKALRSGSSLLPAGAIRIEGKFDRGDLVIVSGAETEIARGISAYSADDANRILGKKSSEIIKILGFSGRDELIHRDDLVLTPQ